MTPVLIPRCRKANLALWLALSTALSSAGQAREYTVEGHYTRVVLTEPKKITNYYGFRMEVRDCKYRLAVSPNGAEYRFGHEELSYDTRNFYHVIYSNRGPIDELKPTDPVPITGWVEARTFPKLGPNWGIHIWFPFGGKCYLASESKGFVSCEFILPDRDCLLMAEVVYNSLDPEVIDRAVIFRPSDLAISQKANRASMAAGSEKGYTNMIFKTLELRKAGNMQVPVAFEWVYFLAPEDDGSQKMLWRALGIVTNVALGVKDNNLLPRLQGRAAIFDYRMAKSTGFGGSPYFASEFYDPESRRFKAEASGIERSNTPHPRAGMPRKPILIGVVLAFAALAYAAIRAGRRRTAGPN